MTPARAADAEQAELSFAGDVAKHVATVTLDDGLHRHIECRVQGTSVYAFTVTTWPRHLAITGDMGSFVFTRLADMFAFFRTNAGRAPNYSYWAEKIEATNKDRGHKQFSPETFEREVTRWLEEWLEGRDDISATEAEGIRGEVRDEVLAARHDGAHHAFRAAMDYRVGDECVFQDFYEVNCDEWTYSYVWCCHAILWAIAQYDRQKAVAS